ncbi:type IV pilin-like G/H family protein [Anabaena catenula]|uniref:Pesticin n=1 Tax=Anabaena catenula FACHB-362 TaxID=2692877 RepID=A0ABR8J3D9_9NOST|nr:type IV pilin-like G/H family protein [Anabaena catenula]MBD2692022.1 pesticin [Anabaena catenula FACHB-362]
MNTQFSRKLLQHILNKKNEQGFTWWQVLLVFIIILVLAAIALPSFIVQTSSELKLSEGKIYVASMNRGQQAYFSENNKFSKSLPELGLGIANQTNKYNYFIKMGTSSVYNYGIARTDKFKNYIGAVFMTPNANVTIICFDDILGNLLPTEPILRNGVPVCGGRTTIPVTAKEQTETVSIICESKEFTTTRPANPILKDGVPVCGEGTVDITKQ